MVYCKKDKNGEKSEGAAKVRSPLLNSVLEPVINLWENVMHALLKLKYLNQIMVHY